MSKKYKVFFIDYGNVEVLTVDQLRFLDRNLFGLGRLGSQAQSGRLLYVKAPKFVDDHGKEAAELFKDLVWEKELVAIVKFRERGNNLINLGNPDEKVHINAQMVKEGYARIEKRDTDDPIYEKLRQEEEIARRQNLGMWIYGVVPDSDEEREEERLKKGIL